VKPNFKEGVSHIVKESGKRDLLANKFSFLVCEKMFLILRWRLEKYILKSPIFLLKEGFQLVIFFLSWSQSEQHSLMHPIGWMVYGQETLLDGWMVCEQKTIVS
jgi:hypothetical protein